MKQIARGLGIALLLVSPMLVSTARADKIVVKSGQGTLDRNNVKIKAVDGDQLVFQSESGNESRQPLAGVVRIEITGETVFNDAETAYAASKWPDAADAYNKALKAASKDWMRDRISLRLIDLAGKTNRFDVAAAGYISLVARNPTLAATVKPALPADKDPKVLADTDAAIDKAVADTSLPADRKVVLLQFDLEIQNALGDKKAAAAVVEQILKTGALNGNDPATQKQFGDFKVAIAQMALDNKDYAKAQAQIEDARAVLNDPQQQCDALFILAECKYQTALANKATEKTVWQDIAIAYMRVVANFSDRPAAGDALARTAACYEQLKDNDKAITVYGQVIKQYGNTPAAKTAQDAIARLKAGN